MNPKKIRSTVIGTIGTRAVHSLQDGFTLGSILSLSVIYPPAVTVVAAVLGIEAVRPRKIIKAADKFVRTEQIQENPEWFMFGFLPWVAATILFEWFGFQVPV